MLRLLIGSLLAAVVLFAWGAVFWGVSPLPFAVMRAVPNDEVVVEVLKKNLPASGVYLSPFPDEERYGADRAEAEKAFLERHRQGPLVQITYRKDGLDAQGPAVFAAGFVHMLVSSLLVGGLLMLALPGLGGYASRVLFVFLAGVFASVTVTLSTPIWFHHPWQFPLLNALYHATNWLLAGFVLGAVIRPRK